MKKTLRNISFPLFILILLSTSCFTQKKDNITIPEGLVGMIGYGSLISINSMEQTLGHKYLDSAYMVHLKGFVRSWTCFRPFNDPKAIPSNYPKYSGFILQNNDSIPFDGIVNLNIELKKRSKMNCVLYLISNEDLMKFDKREVGYERTDVTDRIEEYNITDGKVYVYQQPPEYYDKTSLNLSRYILIKDYIDLITKACDGIGENFRNEFDRSTLSPTSQIVQADKIAWRIVK